MKKNLSQAFLVQSATGLAIVVSCLLSLIKGLVWHKTGSLAVQGSLVDSIIDGCCSCVNFFAIRHALEPADEEHRFGHGKIEALAGIVQASLFVGTAFWIVCSGFFKPFKPNPLEWKMLGLLSVTFPLTAALILWQHYVCKKTGSIAVQSDKLHYEVDFVTDVLACLGVFLLQYEGFYFLDRLMGLGIAMHILRTSWILGKRSFDILMDKELPKERVRSILNLIQSHPDVFNIHGVKTRSSGFKDFMQIHLGLDPYITLIESHRIADEVEAMVTAFDPRIDIIIHQDPDNEPAHD